MPISHQKAYKRGMISSQALSKLQGGGKSTISTKRGPGQPTKMTKFNNDDKVDEHENKPGVLKKNEINNNAQQKTAKVAGQTIGRNTERGGAQQAHGQKGANAINEGNAKKWPTGSNVEARGGRKSVGRHGGGDNNGPATGMKNYYGGPNNNKNG